MALDADDIQGNIWREGEWVVARLQRKIGYAPEVVWKMLTDSVCLSQWLAPGTLEQERGGRVKLDFGNSGTPIDCRISACEPHCLLAYSWSAGDDPERPLVWELSPDGGGTILTLTLFLPDDELIAIACAGWDAHLEMLMAAMEGIRISFPAARFHESRSAFAELARKNWQPEWAER
ncbi:MULTISPECIES: SRPBCC family protein [Marinobacter]|uniref:SRPBCC family protein n=1 Tax=Marinobacter metalliresistant TaxID=2961995 RepID=A0ABZ2W790_9GAMM|nr:SRPBCC family protein [Marinobacter sp. Arc7-DN-1]AXS83141.1 ATPase [Marinobacter sp. Arc7-DN-1]